MRCSAHAPAATTSAAKFAQPRVRVRARWSAARATCCAGCSVFGSATCCQPGCAGAVANAVVVAVVAVVAVAALPAAHSTQPQLQLASFVIAKASLRHATRTHTPAVAKIAGDTSAPEVHTIVCVCVREGEREGGKGKRERERESGLPAPASTSLPAQLLACW